MPASAIAHVQPTSLLVQAVWSDQGIQHEAGCFSDGTVYQCGSAGTAGCNEQVCPPQVWLHRAGLGRWVPVARLGPQAAVACVHWACTVGRAVELVAVGAGERVTVYSLQGPADALEARASTSPPLLTSVLCPCAYEYGQGSRTVFLAASNVNEMPATWCTRTPVAPQCDIMAQVEQVAALDLGAPVWRVE